MIDDTSLLPKVRRCRDRRVRHVPGGCERGVEHARISKSREKGAIGHAHGALAAALPPKAKNGLASLMMAGELVTIASTKRPTTAPQKNLQGLPSAAAVTPKTGARVSAYARDKELPSMSADILPQLATPRTPCESAKRECAALCDDVRARTRSISPTVAPSVITTPVHIPSPPRTAPPCFKRPLSRKSGRDSPCEDGKVQPMETLHSADGECTGSSVPSETLTLDNEEATVSATFMEGTPSNGSRGLRTRSDQVVAFERLSMMSIETITSTSVGDDVTLDKTNPMNTMATRESVFWKRTELRTKTPPDLGDDGLKRWKRGDVIGSGSYGRVYKARDLVSGQIFAVKESLVNDTDEESEGEYRDKLQRELEICEGLSHPNIVSYLGYQRVDGSLCIFLEYVPGGSMASLLVEFGALEEQVLRFSSRGLLHGLDYLHSRDPPVIHRDVKCANVLVTLDAAVKLADFGCSKRDVVTKSFRTIGSIPWMAPEVIQQTVGHGRKADIWSFGCTVIEMASAERPWGKHAFGNILAALMHIGTSNETPPVPASLSSAGQHFISCCLQRGVNERACAAELVDHDFVNVPRA